jgi:hypothetical protein
MEGREEDQVPRENVEDDYKRVTVIPGEFRGQSNVEIQKVDEQAQQIVHLVQRFAEEQKTQLVQNKQLLTIIGK